MCIDFFMSPAQVQTRNGQNCELPIGGNWNMLYFKLTFLDLENNDLDR